MKPWDEELLSPLNAVCLIVARTNLGGELLVEIITDLSAVGRLHLHHLANEEGGYENDYDRALKAISPAQKLLEGWAREGKLTAWGDDASGKRKHIDHYERVGRQIDYATGALAGTAFCRSCLKGRILNCSARGSGM
jgi:hypothetical protein